ncbi:MAG: trimethylamine corrinoid protein 2 [Clostridia bacterium]
MINTPDWEQAKEKFTAWWARENTGRPLMRICGKKAALDIPVEKPDTPEKYHMDLDYLLERFKAGCRTTMFMAEAFPALDINIGPGSLAVYLGSEPLFAWNTVWYKECIHDILAFRDLTYDEDNPWWVRHRELLRKAVELAGGEFYVNIPDIIESMDILAAMRGPQALILDMMDHPGMVKKYIRQIDDLYFQYYDRIYDLVKDGEGASSYTSFGIWGKGRTAKIQCDFNALISPDQFREFVVPSLAAQCEKLDNSMFHLDGPDAARHIDALMEINGLDILQWTYGSCQPDGGDEKWYPLYDKVFEAGKGLWTHIGDGSTARWFEKSDNLVRRYGTRGLYLVYPEMDMRDALELRDKAREEWE